MPHILFLFLAILMYPDDPQLVFQLEKLKYKFVIINN